MEKSAGLLSFNLCVFCLKTLQFDFSSDYFGGRGYSKVTILRINPKVNTEVLCFTLCGPLPLLLGNANLLFHFCRLYL